MKVEDLRMIEDIGKKAGKNNNWECRNNDGHTIKVDRGMI